jgi:metabolite-proton symporter
MTAQADAVGASRERPEDAIRKVATIALIGTSIEWYDFFLYGVAAALVFPTVFFAADLPPLIALISSFLTFAVGFVARPVGGVVFGHFGDRLGRKRALVIALVMMGVATALIGLLPTYAMVGFWAPLLLIILRFTQGLAIGGQWGGAMLLATESAPSDKRGFYGAFAQAGAPVGVVLSNLIVLGMSTGLSNEDFMSWGWRVPFLLSIVLVGVALYVQLRLEDTEAFRRLRALKEEKDRAALEAEAARTGMTVEQLIKAAGPSRSPVLEVIATYPKRIALAAGAFIAVQVAFYIFIAFVVAYGANPAGLGIPRNQMLTSVLIGAIGMVPGVFISAMISDRFGRRRIYMLGAVLLGLWAFAMFPLIDTGSFLWITVSITVGQFFVSMMYGPQAAFFTELFTTKVRYSGASLGYQLGAIFGGAFAPVIATELLRRYDSTFPIAIYIALACVISLVSVWLLHETSGTEIHEP